MRRAWISKDVRASLPTPAGPVAAYNDSDLPPCGIQAKVASNSSSRTAAHCLTLKSMNKR